MKKLLLYTLTFLFCNTILSQEKIPFIDYDDVYTEASKTEDYNEIIKLLNKINKNDSTYCSVLISKSYYLLNSEKYDEAIKVTDEGLSSDCGNSKLSLYINNGLAYSYKGNYNKALEIYNKGLETFPKYYLLWHNKGVALENLNRIDEAVKAYQNAIFYNPKYARPHLQLGNLCYNQELISQALMCYNMYLLLSYNESGAFNTLKSLNNIVSDKNENEANPDIQISPDDESFEDLDLIISNKIALNKNYETGNKINIALTKQNHALLAQLEDFEGNGGFWSKKYVPLFNWIRENDLFDNFTYMLSYSIQNEKYKKVIEQNKKEIASFEDLFYSKWYNILKENSILFDGKTQNVTYNYYNGYVEGIGRSENDKPIGKWIYYNKSGRLKAKGQFNEQGERNDKWTWLHTNGKVKETAIYTNGLLDGKNFQFHENGKPYIVANYKNDKLNGEYKYYNNKGALIQHKYFKDGELDGLYKSFFNVGKELLEFHIPYKNDKVQDKVTEYYANGNIYAETPFVNGKREGVEKKYFWNKKVSSEINYQNGEYSGPYKTYYSNGNTHEIGQSIDNFYNGPWKSFYKDGTLQADYSYNHGYINGLYKYYDTDGKLYYEYLYRKGEVIEYKYFDKEGQILSEGKKKGGEFQFKGHHPNGNISSKGLYDIKGGKEGLWEFYSKNGVLTGKGNHSDNKIIGEYTNYHKNGKIESKSTYKNDSLHGYFSNYHKNGQLKQQGWYKNNLAHGEWRSYFIDGTLEIINFYHKDKLHGVQKYFACDGKIERTIKYKYGELLSEIYYDIKGNALGEINYFPKENNFTVTYKYPNNKIDTKLDYVNGIKHGKYLHYDFYGNKVIEGNYTNGEQDGKWIWYHANGKEQSVRNYLNGNLNGESIDYFEDGTVESKSYFEYGIREGEQIVYHKNGKKVHTTEYFNDKVHCKKVFYDYDENIQLIRFYDHGTLIGYTYLDTNSNELPMITIKNETGKIISYFDNGKIAREMEYKNGDLVNSYKAYYYSGQLENTLTFVDNEYNGSDIEYYPNGNIKSDKKYQMDLLQGITKNYYENGKIKEEINYRNDTRNGEANYYNKNGKLIKKEFYFNGDIYKSETY